jgi:hypothetical protein
MTELHIIDSITHPLMFYPILNNLLIAQRINGIKR